MQRRKYDTTSQNPAKVSVLMASYNSEKYITEAIESILNQTYKDFEFIVVDDKSTDKTLQIIKKYAKKDKRVKVLALKKNVGPSLAANEGLKFVSGKYLFRMDADDISTPDRFAKQINFLKKNRDIVMLGGQCELIDERGDSLGFKRFPLTNKEILSNLFSMNPIQHPASVINLENLSRYSMLHDGNSVMAHDLELVFLASTQGKLANLKDVVLKYRQYSESFSLKNPKKTFMQTLAVRFGSIWKFGYRPSFVGILSTLFQTLFVLAIPNKWIYPIYTYVRGIKKFDLGSVKINLGNADSLSKKTFQLSQS